MKSSNGGGSRRGRPANLTREQKLERQRERWRRKKARQRKEARDQGWQRQANFGYFVQLWVPHYRKLTEALVEGDYLDPGDVDIAPRVDEAVDEYFANVSEFLGSGRFLAHGRARRLAPEIPRTVRVRMTRELAEGLAKCEYQKRRDWGDFDQKKEGGLGRKESSDLAEKRYKASVRVSDCRQRGRHAEAAAAAEEYHRLDRQLKADRDPPRTEMPEEAPEWFVQKMLGNKAALTKVAEGCLHRLYSERVPDPPCHPCNCKLALPACECPSRFDGGRVGALKVPPPVKRPRAGKLLVKNSLYSGPQPRWWRNPRHDDDPIIRSHDKAASVGMKGFYAGGRGAWKNENAIYYPEQDDRASTRDRNKTAIEGEKALQKPYDDPKGMPKSWGNPSDVEPDNEDGIIRIGNRVMEEGVIEPSKDDDEN